METISRISTFRDYVGELTAIYKRTSRPTAKIESSLDVDKFIRPYFDTCMDNHEEMKVIHLNNANKIVNVDHHSSGGTAGTFCDPKLILQKALLIKTTALIMVHNHPSGKLDPSTADIETSKRMKEACKIIGLRLLDSLIITREGYVSLADQALI